MRGVQFLRFPGLLRTIRQLDATADGSRRHCQCGKNAPAVADGYRRLIFLDKERGETRHAG